MGSLSAQSIDSYLAHYKQAFAFSAILYLHCLRATLQLSYHMKDMGQYRLTKFRLKYRDELVPVYTPGESQVAYY